MKITSIESLHADAGWRVFSHLKIVTDDGLVGWSEYNQSYGAKGLSAVIDGLGETLIGTDPRPVEAISSTLYAMTRANAGGIAQQAIAAIENALLDIKAKALGVPVYALFGGPVRDRFRLYWSHCGSYRLNHSDTLGTPPLRSLDDVSTLGAHVRDQGFSALKTNIFLFDEDPPVMYMPGFGRAGQGRDLNPDGRIIDAIKAQIAALRDGAGPGVDILLDLNFNFRTEGYIQVGRALADAGLLWLELDIYDPQALAHIRRSVPMPVASCESLYGRRGFRPYFEAGAMDVAIIDAPWNGVAESLKIAAMADAYETNIAPHNFYGHLSTLMSAHFCAAVPNFRIMEIDIDDVPWKDDLVTEPPSIEDGHLILPTGPGWGADVDEKAVRAHPPR